MLADLLAQQRMPLAVVAASLLAVVAGTWLARERLGLLPGEYAARVWVHRHRPPPRAYRALIAFVSLGRPRVAVATVAAMVALATLAAGWRAGMLIFAAATVVAPARALKARARHQTIPSGHVAYAVALFGMLAWVLLATGQGALSVGIAAVGVAMGPARVLDGGHWLADIAAGYALGVAWLLSLLLIAATWADLG